MFIILCNDSIMSVFKSNFSSEMKIANISLGKFTKEMQTFKYVRILMSLDNKCFIRNK